MNIVKRIKEAKKSKKMFDEMIYERVFEEISKDERQPGLWAKAIADSLGNINIADSLYIKYRAEALKEESVRLYEEFEKRKKNESSKPVQIQQPVNATNNNKEKSSGLKFFLILIGFWILVYIFASIMQKM